MSFLPSIPAWHNTTSLFPLYTDLQTQLFTTPVHPTYLPVPWLDLLGAIRLSVFVEQFVRERNGIKYGEKGAGKRPTILQEGAGILMIVFGGETFLAAILQTTPSWFLSLKTPLLFVLTHLILTRSPYIHYLIPSLPSLPLEAVPFSIFDSLGRAIVLTTFSVDTITSHPNPLINSNPTAMILAAWIAVVPFASLTFAFNMFDRSWSFSTPPDLLPGGWRAVDFWAPPMIAWLYGALTSAHPVFEQPYQFFRGVAVSQSQKGGSGPVLQALGWEEMYARLPVQVGGWGKGEARAICGVVLAVLFALRAVYNFGGQWGGVVRKVVGMGERNVEPVKETTVKAISEKSKASPKLRKIKEKTQ